MRISVLAALSCLGLFTAGAHANPLGVLSNVWVSDPGDGVSETSLVTPMVMTTNLPEGFEDDLTIPFQFSFDPSGTQINLATVIPIDVAGLNVWCSNFSQEVSSSGHGLTPNYASCTMHSDFVASITEPVTLRFRFLGGGGTSNGVGTVLWHINPYVAPPLVPVNVDTIAVNTPVRRGDLIRIVFELNRPAEENPDANGPDDTWVRYLLTPSACFIPSQSRGDLLINNPRQPDNLYGELIYAPGQSRRVIQVQTELCSPTSFVVETWMGTWGRIPDGVENFSDPATSYGREVPFLVEQ